MNKIIYFVSFWMLSNFCLAQHTEKFNSFASQLTPIDTIYINSKFENGKPKLIATELEYDFGSYIYTFPTGKYIEYFKNGNKYFEAEYDSFANELSRKIFDSSGNLLSESKTSIIDTKANNIVDFLAPKKYFKITSYNKIYKFSKKLNVWYLESEGEMINSRKIGKWKKYHKNGTLKN